MRKSSNKHVKKLIDVKSQKSSKWVSRLSVVYHLKWDKIKEIYTKN